MLDQVSGEDWFSQMESIIDSSDQILSKPQGPSHVRPFITFIQDKESKTLVQLTFDKSIFTRERRADVSIDCIKSSCFTRQLVICVCIFKTTLKYQHQCCHCHYSCMLKLYDLCSDLVRTSKPSSVIAPTILFTVLVYLNKY